MKFSDIQNILGSLNTSHQILGQIIQENRDENSSEQTPVIKNLITAFNNIYDVINFFQNIPLIIDNTPEQNEEEEENENDIEDPIVLKGKFKHLGIMRDVKDAYRIIDSSMEKQKVAIKKLDTAMNVLSIYVNEDFPPNQSLLEEEEEEEEKYEEKQNEKESQRGKPKYQSLLEEEEEEEEAAELPEDEKQNEKESQRGKPKIPSSDSEDESNNDAEEEDESNNEAQNEEETEEEVQIDSDENETEEEENDDDENEEEESPEKSRTNKKFFLGFINKKYGVNTYQTVYKPKKKILQILDELLQSKDFSNNTPLLEIQQVLNEKVFNENALYKRIKKAIKILKIHFNNFVIKQYGLLTQLSTELDKLHDAVKNLPDFDPCAEDDEKPKTQKNTKMHLGFINKKYGINVYRPIYLAKKNIRIAMDNLFKDKKFSNDQFLNEVNRLVNVETNDEETLLANIQQARNVLFTRFKPNQINSITDLNDIVIHINIMIKCLQTLPQDE